MRSSPATRSAALRDSTWSRSARSTPWRPTRPSRTGARTAGSSSLWNGRARDDGRTGPTDVTGTPPVALIVEAELLDPGLAVPRPGDACAGGKRRPSVREGESAENGRSVNQAPL